MTAEELEKQKEDFFRNLEQDCPRGMCYLGIEYECTLEGSLAFYDRAFLESEPRISQGSASVMMMLLRPDEPIGKHGLLQPGNLDISWLQGDFGLFRIAALHDI